MRFLVLVTPVENEAEIIAAGQDRAGLAWLKAKIDAGIMTAEAYPQTGGYMLVETESRASLRELLADYPLLSTITLDIREVVSLDKGFAKLAADYVVADAARTASSR